MSAAIRDLQKYARHEIPACRGALWYLHSRLIHNGVNERVNAKRPVELKLTNKFRRWNSSTPTALWLCRSSTPSSQCIIGSNDRDILPFWYPHNVSPVDRFYQQWLILELDTVSSPISIFTPSSTVGFSSRVSTIDIYAYSKNYIYGIIKCICKTSCKRPSYHEWRMPIINAGVSVLWQPSVVLYTF